jgi:hypothetical protein
MAYTDIGAVRKQKKAEHKQYRLKRKLLLQQQASKDIHDPVLSSLKMEGIRLLFPFISSASAGWFHWL